ncbi:hypothetical protein D3C72_1779860 [compost metagenome]
MRYARRQLAHGVDARRMSQKRLSLLQQRSGFGLSRRPLRFPRGGPLAQGERQREGCQSRRCRKADQRIQRQERLDRHRPVERQRDPLALAVYCRFEMRGRDE